MADRKKSSVSVAPETLAQLKAAAAKVKAPSVGEMLRMAAFEPGSIMRAYVLGVRREAELRVAAFEKWSRPLAEQQPSAAGAAPPRPEPASTGAEPPAGSSSGAAAGGGAGAAGGRSRPPQ